MTMRRQNVTFFSAGLAVVAMTAVAFVGHPAAQTPPAVQAPAAPVDPAKAAIEVVDALAAGEYAKVTARFDAPMKAAITEDRLKATWTGLVGQFGPLKSHSSARVQPNGTRQVATVSCAFERATLEAVLVFNPTGEIGGFSMRPPATPYAPPPYATMTSLTEEDATVGSGEWALPGTLTLPTGTGPFPGVVLVHGSGPNDRDETIGPNKPFRDLALGLASRGIAVLRYEKRTKQYPSKLSSIPAFTVKEETVDDAVAAVDSLRKHPKIDARRIVVIGHSLGGMLIPRIAAADPRIAGFVVMAGAVRSLEQAILEQTRYVASLDGTITPQEQQQIDGATALVTRVKALTPDDAKTPQMISGAPASYWLDLRGYDPPVAARSVERSMLVLQGERDYQVTMEEFARWKAALPATGGAPGRTFKSYPALNHLFMPGTGPASPADYATANHVAPEVVQDIAAFVLALRPAS